MPDHHEYCTGGFSPDDIVITGMSGRFPFCSNAGEFLDALMTQKNLLEETGERFQRGAMDLPFGSAGSLQNLDKFDMNFFGFTAAAADASEPLLRQLLEVSYEALVDAGYDPLTELRGGDIGVYSAVTNQDAKLLMFKQEQEVPKSLHTSVIARCMIANRISYFFDFRGPTYVMDSACSSSFVALSSAVNDIRQGNVDAALVTGGELNLDPAVQSYYNMTGIVSPTNSCCPLDAKADGIVRSEACTALFIQKASAARRAYATILDVKHTSAGYVKEGVTKPSAAGQVRLYQKVLTETKLKSSDFQYVEVHGTGTFVGDPIEVKAVDQVYCKDRKDALYIGSVKSNAGHSEASAGHTAAMKVIFAFETGVMPPNYRFESPNLTCDALREGRLRVVADPLPLTSPYVPISCFGIGGSLTHAILKRNPIEYSKNGPDSEDIPRLVLYCATTEPAVMHVLEYVRKHPELRKEFFALLNKSFSPTIQRPFRGYALLQAENPVIRVKNCMRDNREIWFVMTGMGCQWPGMGLEMMRIKAFAESMHRSAAVLKPLGLDLFRLLEKDGDALLTSRRITPAFVAIASIQIALIDVLRALEIHPNGMIGHSTGELICAYADGCCTAEQTILSAYWRGACVESSKLVHGAMAAVGLSWDEAVKRCPKGVHPACHNATDSVTISGLAEPLKKFVAELQQENIFARVVNAYDYAFHCEHVWPAADALRNRLKTVIKEPKPRSKRWVSTSYSEEEWGSENCRMAGVEYFVHNLMSAVRFEEGLRKLPPDAVTVEIGPHFLLQSILKRSVGPDSTNIGLMKRSEANNVGFFLESLGKLYQEGVYPKIENLYQPVQFPVPRSTPMISNLIQWDHSRSFHVPKWEPMFRPYKHNFFIDSTDRYLLDHFIDGRSLFPATGYIYLAWKALAYQMDRFMTDVNVVIEDLKIHRAVPLNMTTKAFFVVAILEGVGYFEIMEGKSTVATGNIYEMKKNVEFPYATDLKKHSKMFISGNDVYNEIKIHGYEYGSEFRRVAEINIDGSEGFVAWNGKWIPFLDALLLFFMYGAKDKSRFVLPTGIRSVKIDSSVLLKGVEESEREKLPGLPVNFSSDHGICRSLGVEISGLQLAVAPHNIRSDDCILEEYKFIPYSHTYEDPEKSKILEKYIRTCDDIVKLIKAKISSNDKENGFSASDVSPYLRDFLSDFNEKYVLLWNLKNFSDFDLHTVSLKERKCIFQNYVNNIGQDISNSALVNDYCLKYVFDTVTENSFKKISVLEISNKFPVILPALVENVEKNTFSQLKSKILISDDENSVDRSKISDCGIQFHTSKSLKSVVKEKSQGLVISGISCDTYEDVRTLINLLCTVIEENGFIMLLHKGGTHIHEQTLADLCEESLQMISDFDLEKIFIEKDLVVVSKISSATGGNLYLLRHAAPTSSTKIIKLTEKPTWFQDLKNSISHSTETIWVASEGCPTSGIIGMINCLKHEPGGEKIRCVFDASTDQKDSSLLSLNLEDPVFKDIMRKNLLMNVYRQGQWGSFRHIKIDKEIKPVEVDYSLLTMKRIGDLSSFVWLESPLKYRAPEDRDVTQIYYSALNFKDVMLASGKLADLSDEGGRVDCILGLEYAGRNMQGERVAGFSLARSLATAIECRPDLSFPVPDHWSLEDAATVPCVYITCYYGLIMRAGLKHGKSVLIHSGTGGIGMAAINIATSLNCEIYTTVGTQEKRQFLLDNFPQIKPQNIGCSRNASFEDMIMERTNGKGVDVVLNSLAGELMHASIRCVANFGRFVEIGKYDIFQDHKIGLQNFDGDKSFHAVALDKVIREGLDFKPLKRLLLDGIEKGIVKPLKRTVFSHTDVEKAFRYMGKGVHMGKVIIKIRDEETTKICVPKLLRLPAMPVTYFYPHKVYIIIGGLGGFGIEVANWILKKGARNVILTSRFGARTPYHHLCLKRWKDSGYNVVISTKNVSVQSEAEELLKEAATVGPIGGIFNSAVVLKDSFLENMNYESFKAVCAPKADATRHLDTLSRNMCPELDHFVCFSSMSCGRGNAGQMNYGYANSVMERICEQRRADGLPGVAVQWGIIGEVGLVHRHMGDDAMIAGVGAQRVKSCLEILDASCILNKPVVSSYTIKGISRKKDHQKSFLQKLVQIFGFKDESEFETSKSMSEMGVDSIMGTEIKLILETTLNTTFTMKELQDMKLDELKALLTKEEADKNSGTRTPTLVSTISIPLPKTCVHDQDVVSLNDVKSGTPVFLLDIDCNDISEISALGKAFDHPFYCLLLSKNAPTSDLSSLAHWYLEILKKVTVEKFHIIARSTASVLGAEMLLQSQQDRRNILSLTILDGCSTLLKFCNKGSEMSDADILLDFIADYIPLGMKELKGELSKSSSIEQQVRNAVHLFTKYSAEELDQLKLTDIIKLHVNKIKIMRNHAFKRKLERDILVMEDSMKLLANEVAEVKLLLSQIFSGNIKIQRIPDLVPFTDESAKIIAKALF